MWDLRLCQIRENFECKKQEGYWLELVILICNNHMYGYTCMEPGCMFKYIGESHNNFMTRSKEHLDKSTSKK